jgi:hypothetical protein
MKVFKNIILYKIMNEIVNDNIECKNVLINGKLLEVYSDGRIYRFNKKNEPIIVENSNNDNGYNTIWCNGKLIKRHRIIGFAFLNLDIEDPKQCIDHRNGQKLNNCVSNLRVVTHQQNHMNRTKSKGYYWNKQHQKFQAQIMLNNKIIYLGLFTTEEDARTAYLAAKQIYHVIN